MQNNSENNYKEWLKKADEDELSGKTLLKEKGGAPSTICFLSQQMAEKGLKTLLVFNKKSFPKVHDLFELETLVLKIYKDVRDLDEEIKILNRYYIETRYPGDFPEFSWNDAKEAFEAAKNIKSFVLNKIK